MLRPPSPHLRICWRTMLPRRRPHHGDRGRASPPVTVTPPGEDGPMANSTASRSIHLRRSRSGPRSAGALPVWLRRFRVEVLLWAFREGRAVDAAALTAVLGA